MIFNNCNRGWNNWWFGCGKKIDYKSKETAQKSATRMNDKGIARNPLESYQCDYCNGWHIGRKKTLWRRFIKIFWRIKDWILRRNNVSLV